MKSFIETKVEEIMEDFPISFFATENYNGEPNELFFTAWQDKQTKLAFHKQVKLRHALGTALTATLTKAKEVIETKKVEQEKNELGLGYNKGLEDAQASLDELLINKEI